MDHYQIYAMHGDIDRCGRRRPWTRSRDALPGTRRRVPRVRPLAFGWQCEIQSFMHDFMRPINGIQV